jgi:hypothetical protein
MYFDKEKNRQERIKFVEIWAEFVRTHLDEEWSKQQNVLINSMFQNAQNNKLTREEYLKIKGNV